MKITKAITFGQTGNVTEKTGEQVRVTRLPEEIQVNQVNKND